MNFYFEACKVLDRLDGKQGSIKGIIASLPEKDRKRTAALVIETLKFKAVLHQVIEASDLLKTERKKITSLNLALVLVHDLLLARGIQAGDGPVKQAILRHKARLHGEFQKAKIKKGVSSNAGLANDGDERAASIPRYVRVNTLKASIPDVVSALQEQGFTEGDPFNSKTSYATDKHVPGLLLLPPQTSFQNNTLYTSGKIILQDKASCLPATVLSPPACDTTVAIDATAAPGNKTSHLSALMGNKGQLYAFERDRKRFSTLETMLSKAGCKNVVSINADFLTIDPQDSKYRATTHILLDPSCSGSGIVNRLDYLLDEGTSENDPSSEDRLNKLAAFQLTMIRHAMRFPNVKKIVYSTCSIHATENEHVVRDALMSAECQIGGFVLASRDEVLPQWHRRGHASELDDEAHAESLIRCSPGEDATNGFFVSCFVRKSDSTSSKRKADEMSQAENDMASVSKKTKKKKKKRKTVTNEHP